MVVNVSIRNFALSIGGLDCKQALMEFSGADSKIDQSGLVIFSGSMSLARPVGFENLDDRVNPRWARAAPILFDVADDSNTLARAIRFGTLFITDAVYARSDRRLNIEVTDLLGLLSNKEGEEGQAPKACVGEGGASALSAINQLLTLAGVPAPLLVADPVPGNINAPINGGSGYIQQAGAIAASQGWFLYVEGTTGRVRARSIDVDQVTPLYSLSVQDSATEFSRSPDKPPAQKMVVSGTGKIVTPIPQTNNVTESFVYGPLPGLGGGDLLLRRRVSSESIVGSVRTLSIKVFEALGALFPEIPSFAGNGGVIQSEEYTEVHYYESQSPVTSGGSDCENGNQGRLLSTVITSRKCFGTVFKGLIGVSEAKGLVPPLTYLAPQLTYLTDDFTEVTTYQYTPAEIGTGKSLGRGPRINRKKRQPLGAIMPDYFKSSAYRPINSAFIDDMVDTEIEQDYWFQKNTGEWLHEHTLRQSLILHDAALADRIHAAHKKANRQCDTTAYAALVTIDDNHSSNDNSAPPSASTLPPKYEISDKDVSASYDLPQDANWDFRDRSQVLSFDYLSGNSVGAISAQAYGLAKIWGVIGWGRYRGSQVSGAMSTFLLSAYSPGDLVAADEGGWISTNLSDGFAIGMSGTELIVSLDLMHMGRVNPPMPPANQVILTLDNLRAIPPEARFDGMLAYNP